MFVNSCKINSSQINAGPYLVAGGDGQLIEFEQTVELRITGEGQLIDFEQAVINQTESSQLITFDQVVYDPTDTNVPFVTRNGWYPIIKVGTYRIPDNMLCGVGKVSRTENNAAQLEFSILMPLGVWDYNRFIGKPVTVDIKRTVSGQAVRLYTGIVNLPDIDLINKRIVFSCSDNRREQINSQMAAAVKSIGWYNTEIFGESEDVAAELDNRLTTVPYSVDFNQAGQYTISSMLAKSSPDYTLNDGDVCREGSQDPQVKLIPRGRIVNKINVAAEYRYTRLYHREVSFIWDATNTLLTACDFLQAGYSIPTREMINSAIQSTGWPVRNTVVYTEPLPSGTYSCGGATVGWDTNQTVYAQVAVTKTNPDPSGPDVPVLDAKGSQVYQSVPTQTVDTKNTTASAAAWIASKRWAQNISEKYTLSVSCPESISQYGQIVEDDTVGITSEYDTSAWENYTQYRNEPSVSNITHNGNTYYLPADTNLSGWYSAVYVMLNRARTSIIKSHRDNRVIFQTALWPEIDLVHTVYLDCTRIQAKGKVMRIEHMLDKETGEAKTVVELALSLVAGSGSDSTLSIPSRPSYTPNIPTFAIALGSHWGEPPNARWTGYIGNKYVTVTTGATKDTKRTKYTEQFIVQTPAIEDNVRLNQELTSSASYNMAIQNDLLVITGV